MLDLARLRAAYEQAKGELLAERTPDGHWVGELSSSALSTATAVSALAVVRGRSRVQGRKSKVRRLTSTLDLGPSTLDDSRSPAASTISSRSKTPMAASATPTCRTPTSRRRMLVVAALHLAGVADEHAELARAGQCLHRRQRPPGRPARALRHRQDVRRADHDEPGAGGAGRLARDRSAAVRAGLRAAVAGIASSACRS